MKKLKSLFLFFLVIVCSHSLNAQSPPVGVAGFVSRFYIHGLPYDEARALGKDAVPQLVGMLQDKSMEPFWSNIVTTLGYIGDPSAINALVKFMEESKGEISANRFRAILLVFQAIGHISQNGDAQSFKILRDYTSLTSWKSKNLLFKYQQYSNEKLSEVLARQTFVGLGISGRPEALKELSDIRLRPDTRKDWLDNLDEGMRLNNRVKLSGSRKVFGKNYN